MCVLRLATTPCAGLVGGAVRECVCSDRRPRPVRVWSGEGVCVLRPATTPCMGLVGGAVRECVCSDWRPRPVRVL